MSISINRVGDSKFPPIYDFSAYKKSGNCLNIIPIQGSLFHSLRAWNCSESLVLRIIAIAASFLGWGHFVSFTGVMDDKRLHTLYAWASNKESNDYINAVDAIYKKTLWHFTSINPSLEPDQSSVQQRAPANPNPSLNG